MYSTLPRPRHTDVNYAGGAQHQDQGRHEDQSVREHSPLNGDTRVVGPSDDVLLLQGRMDVGRDNRQFVGDCRRNVTDGFFVQY